MLMMERRVSACVFLTLSPVAPPPSHPQWWEHEVFVLSDKGVVMSGDKRTAIEKDSVVFVAPDEHHCFVNNSSEPLYFICVIPLLA